MVKDTYDWFREMVQERRGMDDAALDKVADGRVFTGRQALELKLVDAARRREDRDRLAGEEKKIKQRLAGARLQARSRGSAT